LSPTEPSRFLIIETSGRIGTVALAAGPVLLSVRVLDETRRHARDLAPTTAALLAERRWRPRDLAAVVVSIGPGSYTGLRVGIMSAKAFAYATGCVLIGVPTFSAVATQAPEHVNELDVIADAQQEKVYTQRFARTAVGWRATAELRVVPFNAWLADRTDATWVSGPGLRRRLMDIPGGERVTPETCWEPRPESLLQLGLARYLQGERDDLHGLEPLYLRPSSAEVQWKERGSGSLGDPTRP
jgi:tRNA threonylcarbamoyladenosine biosynthesis protein TsaB